MILHKKYFSYSIALSSLLVSSRHFIDESLFDAGCRAASSLSLLVLTCRRRSCHYISPQGEISSRLSFIQSRGMLVAIDDNKASLSRCC